MEDEWEVNGKVLRGRDEWQEKDAKNRPNFSELHLR